MITKYIKHSVSFRFIAETCRFISVGETKIDIEIHYNEKRRFHLVHLGIKLMLLGQVECSILSCQKIFVKELSELSTLFPPIMNTSMVCVLFIHKYKLCFSYYVLRRYDPGLETISGKLE